MKKKEICQRCKRELDWEEKEIIRNMPRELLEQFCITLKNQLNKTGGKNGIC